MKKSIWIVLLLVMPLFSRGALAEGAAGSSLWQATSALPGESDLGTNWFRMGTGEPILGDGVFTDGAIAVFAGSVGSQLTVIIFVHDRAPAAVGRAWAAASAWQTQAFAEAVAIDSTTWQGESELARPFPKGVVDAHRVEGVDAWSWLPVGVGLYAFEHNVMALLVLEGRIHPDVQRTGVDALDYIAGLIAIRAAH